MELSLLRPNATGAAAATATATATTTPVQFFPRIEQIARMNSIFPRPYNKNEKKFFLSQSRFHL